MASIDGEFVGPLIEEDAATIVQDILAGRPVLKSKQLRFRRCQDDGTDPGQTPSAPPQEFVAPADTPRADTVGLTSADRSEDRPGPSAAIETTPEIPSEDDE
jgi:hypothetical protein